MRKTFLVDEKREEKKKQRIVIILAIVVIAIFGFSSIAFIVDYNNNGNAAASSTSEYGQKFVSVQLADGSSAWQTKLAGEQRQFSRLPTQVAFVPLDSQVSSAFPFVPQLQAIVISVDANSDFTPIILNRASVILSDLYTDKKQILPAIIARSANITTLPVISCDNQTYFAAQNLSGKIPIIQIQEGNETSISARGNCIILQGADGEGIISAVERFRYGIWGLDFSKDPAAK